MKKQPPEKASVEISPSHRTLQEFISQGFIKLKNGIDIMHLKQSAKDLFAEGIEKYLKKTHNNSFTLSSGVRSAEEQASAMFHNFSNRHAPHYRQADLFNPIKAACNKNKKYGPEQAIEAMTDVINDQVKKNRMISNHLSGECVDISLHGLNVKAMKAALRECGIRSDIHCDNHLHVELKPMELAKMDKSAKSHHSKRS